MEHTAPYIQHIGRNKQGCSLCRSAFGLAQVKHGGKSNLDCCRCINDSVASVSLVCFKDVPVFTFGRVIGCRLGNRSA
eukprot:scaffold215057_cov20-Tisochrysis_lutea.AAC.1